MDLSSFSWSVIASIVATVIAGGSGIAITYKIITNNQKKTKNVVKQGDNSKTFIGSTININSHIEQKGVDGKDGEEGK